MPFLLILSCEQTTGPGEDITEVTNKLIIYTNKTSMVANKGSASVFAKVYSENDTSQAVSGVRVQFSADNSATISMLNSVTDNTGIARATVYAGDKTGTVKITAAIQNYSNSAFITVTPDSGLIDTTLNMKVTGEPSVLAANGTDISVVKAQLFDSDNNPVQGETIYFTTSLGIIQESAMTDEWGTATVNLKSERTNGQAIVTARYNQVIRTTLVAFTGSQIKSQISPTILVADNKTKAAISITLNDASGSPVPDGVVNVSTTLGTLYSSDSVSSGTAIIDSTSAQGKVTVFISSSSEGNALIRISALGSADSLSIYFTNYTFALSADKSQIYAGGNKTKITAVLKDNKGAITPINLPDVSFSTNLGVITPLEKKIDGTVVAELTSGSSVGTATVTASMKTPPVVASTQVSFIAAAVDSVFLRASTPSVRLGGSEIEIRATVFDITGNSKSGETVSFSIIKGPGGGESISPGTAVTNDRGIATVSFKSGDKGSEFDGVEIQAHAGSIVSNILKITIAGEPYSVVVGINTDSFSTNPNGTLGVSVTAIVSDVNRNKVSDGTLVSFSLKGGVGVIADQAPTTDGVAATTLIYSSSDAGKEVTVTASSGGIQGSDTEVLPGKAGTPATLQITPKVTSVLADGVSGTSIEIFLTDTNGQPLSNRIVYCETDLGEIQPSAITGDPSDPNSTPGKANVSFTGPALWDDRIATIRIYTGEIQQTGSIHLNGISMTINAEPAELPSDGQSKSTIQVLVKEKTSHIPITGQTVRFGASVGSIAGRATTDESGIATTTFKSGLTPGTAYIKVSFGSTLVDSIAINIKEVKARGIELSANPTQIPANGISTSTITALLRDDNFNPVVGENIIFSTTLGTISAADTTDENGKADAVLVSDRMNGEAVVTAKFKQNIATIPVNFTGVTISVSAIPENLFAGGEDETTVAAYVKDAAEVPIVGSTVKFTWYLDDTLKGELSAKTDVQGRASITLSSRDAGRARIVADGAGATDDAFVTFTQLKFTVSSLDSTISTGGDSLQVWAQLFDTVQEKYIEGAVIEFYTTLGTITQSSVTDSQGKAYAYLVSGNTAGLVTISASTRYNNFRVSADKNLTYVNAQPSAIDLRVDANIVSVNGGSSRLIAVVTDKYGNPVPEALVSFKVIKGPAGGEYINPPIVTTGTSGVASTFFYSGQVPSAFESVEVQAQIGNVISNVTKLTIAGAPEIIRPGYKTEIDPVKMDNGDGTFSLPISALVLDANSNGVVDGTTVYFKIEPAEGAVISPVKTVNSVAQSTITYPSASAGKKITLTASSGGKEGKITFMLPGFTVSYLSITASPKSIPADGKSQSTISATIFDISGSSLNVPDGTPISFTTEGGTLYPIVASTREGVATTVLTSDKNAGRYIMVTAKTGLLEDFTYVWFEVVGTSVNQVADIELSVEPSMITADGSTEAIITAILKKYNDEIVTIPTNISFEADIGEIEKFKQSDENGKAVVRFTSGFAGTATITAQVGEITRTATVVIVPSPSQMPEIIRPGYQAGIDPSKMDNNDGTFSLPISAVVLDANSNGVVDGTTVYFKIDPPEGAVLSPVKTTDSVAQSKITYPYASAGKEITLTASAGGKEGNITFILPGFQASYLSISASPKSIPADGKSQTTISATLFDKSGSSANIPDGTPVSFTTDGGTLDPIVASTKDGVATTVLTSDKNPNNYVRVSVKTGSREEYIYINFVDVGTTVNQVTDIELSVDPYIIIADGSTEAKITAVLKKYNDEIVTEPTNVLFETDIGTIERIKQSDENGKAVVSFTSGFTGTATITAKVGEVTRTATVIIVSGPSQLPEIIRPGYQTDIDPITMDNNDGTFTLPISALVLDANSNSVADGTTVNFTIDPPEGAVLSPVNTVKSIAQSTITYPYASAGKEITLTASAGGKEGKITFTLPGFKASYFTLSGSLVNVLDNGNSQVTIIATIFDAEGSSENIPDGTLVSFTTDNGSIEPIVAGTKNGVATAELTINLFLTPSQKVQVKAKTGSLEATLNYSFEGFWETINQVADIELSVDPSVITADGTTEAKITALLKKYTGEIVTTPTNVMFETDIGAIEPYKQSDENGKAVVSFTSGYAGTATITAKVGKTIEIATVIIVSGPSQMPEIIRPGYQTDIDPASMDNGDGTFSLPISALVLDANSNSVVDGTTVYFKIDPPEGAVLSPVKTTDSVAQSKITYPYASAGKEITLTASAGGKEGKITFTLPGFKASYITISASLMSITDAGESQISIIATIYDLGGSSANVPDGTNVSFTTDTGSIDPIFASTENGVATTVLTINVITFKNVQVKAKSGSFEGILDLNLERFVETVNQVADIKLSVDPSVITADGISEAEITALLKKYTGEIVTAPTNVMFETDIGVIEQYKQSDVNGKAVVSFTSGFAGTATITAKVGEVTKTVTVIIVSGPSQLPEILRPGYQTGIDPDDMDNNDGTFTLPVSALVLDANSNGVVDGTTVYFKIDPPEGAVLSPVKTTDSVAQSTITYPYASAGKEITLTASAGGKEGKITFTLPGFKVSYLSISASPNTIPADGKSQTTITVTLLDNSGSSANVPDGTSVSFTTDGGTLAPVVAATENGVATTVLTSDKTANRYVMVTAKTGSLENTTTIYFETVGATVNQVADIELTVDPSIIIADGSTESKITALLKKYTGEIVTAPTNVMFETDIGVIERYKQSDVNGKAVVSFTSGFAGTATITAKVGEVTKTVTVIIVSGPSQLPEILRPGYQTDIDPDDMDNKDGTFTLPISSLVLDANSNGVADGTTVYFTIDPPEGAVMSPVNTVKSVAKSTITYPYASAGKEITLTASAGGKEGKITFTLPGFKVSYLSVSASPNTIPADGKSQTTITATLLDINGSSANVPDGTPVSFTTNGGTLDPVVANTENGVATTLLTSDKIAGRDVTVTAKTGTLENSTTVYFETVGTSVNKVTDIELSVDPSIIIADGLTEAVITALLKQFDEGIVTQPTNVTFETDIGDIERYKQSDENGKAVVRFTSGVVGTATITAKVGETVGTVTVIIVPGPPQSVQLSFSPTSVGVQGSGRNETLLITANVKDNKNNPVGDGHLVKFQLVGMYDTKASISPPGDTNYESALVPTVNGSASVSFHSGTKAGSVRVKATVVDENGMPVDPAVTSEATQFIVYSAPAYLDMTDLNDPFTESRMTLSGSQLNIYAGELNTENSKTTITVAVADRYNNPVPEGTAVYFTTTGGYVTTNTGFTDKNGMASVTLYAANPFPTLANSGEIPNPNYEKYGGPKTFDIPPFPGLSAYYDPDGNGSQNDGFAIVTAYTEGVDHLGGEVTVWNYVPIIFSLQVSTSTFSISAVPAAPDTLYLGDTRRFEIILQDINGNPVIGGSELTFSSALGKLSYAKLTTNSPGVTRYYIDLTNDLDPLTDSPGKTVVTVTLDSPNGKGTVSDDIYMSTSNK